MPSLPKPKFIPTHIYEWRRLRGDRRLDKFIQTPEGRHQYWDVQLPAECARIGMIGLLEQSLSLEGDVIECGVYRGETLMKIARTVRQHAPGKMIYAMDSFGGFPEEKVLACDIGKGRRARKVRKKFRLCADTPQRIRNRFEIFGVNGDVVPGFFSETLGRFTDQRFCFIHLDVDIYRSYLECLEALYPRLVPGGVVVFDECETGAWPGSLLAIKEFFRDRQETVQLYLRRDEPAFFVQRPGEAQRTNLGAAA